MTQSSMAVSVNAADWAVINASPDIRMQLAASPRLFPQGLRLSPLKAVILTNADLDHIAGLLSLREKAPFEVFATHAVLDVIAGNSVFRALDPNLVHFTPILLDTSFEPLPGLTVTPYAVPGKVALFLEEGVPDLEAMGEQTIALRLNFAGRVAHYVPGCAALPDWLVTRLSEAEVLFFDGTVYHDDDMVRSGTGAKTGRRMGHIAMSGRDGSLDRLAGLHARKVFTHINNTNPILLPDSAERAHVIASGWEIAQDGQEYRL